MPILCLNHYLSRDFIPFVLKHYGLSLQFGNKFIYQSMPRLLTIWLNFGATVSDQGKASLFKNEKIDQLIKKKIMDTNYYTAACGLEGSFHN